MNSQETTKLVVYERIMEASKSMTDVEKNELEAWEKQNVTGGGKNGTSDWPGWSAVLERVQH